MIDILAYDTASEKGFLERIKKEKPEIYKGYMEHKEELDKLEVKE